MASASDAKVIRAVTEREVAWKTRGTAEYQELARACLAGLTPVEPLKAVEADRPDVEPSDILPLQEARENPT